MELYSVIKNDGPGDVLFWKFSGEDFRTGSQLIVAENEEALFVRDGIIQEVFDGGRYTLTTNNYPFIDTLRAKFSGGVSAFNCKVFFIDKAHVLELYWGTDSPIQMRDPLWGIMVNLQARGSYTIQVEDSKKFVLKFVANNTMMKTNEEFNDKFRTVFMQKIKSVIPKAIRESGSEILGVCERQDEFAETLTPVMNQVMEEYGVRIVNFYIGAMDLVNDANRAKLENAHANNAEILVQGANWQRIQGRDILMATAKNPGGAGIAAGIGAGMAAGGAMGAMAASVFSPMQPPASQTAPSANNSPRTAELATCPSCGAQISRNAKFCPECGAKNEQKKSFCENCGAELSPTAKFCPECGTKKS